MSGSSSTIAATRDPLFSSRAIRTAAYIQGVEPAELTAVGHKPSTSISHARWAVMLAMHRRGVPMMRIGARFGSDRRIVRYGLRRADALLREDGVGFGSLFRMVDAA